MTYQHEIAVATSGRGTVEITAAIEQCVKDADVAIGLCNVFIAHTSASLIVCENADSDVRSDLERFFSDLIQDGDARFDHVAEGPDDMAAHIRSILTQTSITIPVTNHRLALGTWQGVYLWEHRHRGHRRRLTITVFGE